MNAPTAITADAFLRERAERMTKLSTLLATHAKTEREGNRFRTFDSLREEHEILSEFETLFDLDLSDALITLATELADNFSYDVDTGESVVLEWEDRGRVSA